MFDSVLAVAVFGLLWAFTSSQTVNCSGQYLPVTGKDFTSLNTSISNEFVKLLCVDLSKTKTTVTEKNPAVTKCLASIHTKQTECINCINTTCQARVDALKCTEVVAQASSSSGSCGLIGAICGIQAVVAKAGVALVKVGTAIKLIIQKTVLDIIKFAKQVNEIFRSGLQTAGNEIKKEAKVNPSTAKNEAFFHTVFTGRKRRQASTMEPTCETFQTDSNACLYYHSQCASCSAFGLGDSTEPTTSQLISGVCSQADLDSYNLLDLAIQRIDDTIETYANFTFYAARFIRLDISSYLRIKVYPCVQVDFGMVVNNFALDTSPNDPHVAETAGKIIANDIYSSLSVPKRHV